MDSNALFMILTASGQSFLTLKTRGVFVLSKCTFAFRYGRSSFIALYSKMLSPRMASILPVTRAFIPSSKVSNITIVLFVNLLAILFSRILLLCVPIFLPSKSWIVWIFEGFSLVVKISFWTVT